MAVRALRASRRARVMPALLLTVLTLLSSAWLELYIPVYVPVLWVSLYLTIPLTITTFGVHISTYPTFIVFIFI
ncbi:hypothetical protein K440DRAFT_618775 [Wilcoxina mikolae CBS 423.85]|nr:hypothetical protein K440DRAFT_618775 [Wilcoxina mikolae CBS 423.85]